MYFKLVEACCTSGDLDVTLCILWHFHECHDQKLTIFTCCGDEVDVAAEAYVLFFQQCTSPAYPFVISADEWRWLLEWLFSKDVLEDDDDWYHDWYLGPLTTLYLEYKRATDPEDIASIQTDDTLELDEFFTSYDRRRQAWSGERRAWILGLVLMQRLQ